MFSLIDKTFPDLFQYLNSYNMNKEEEQINDIWLPQVYYREIAKSELSEKNEKLNENEEKLKKCEDVKKSNTELKKNKDLNSIISGYTCIENDIISSNNKYELQVNDIIEGIK